MMAINRHARSTAFLCGALFMATFGAPLCGALSSLIWTPAAHLSDGPGGDTLAADMVVRGIGESSGAATSLHPYRLTAWRRPETGDQRDCRMQFRKRIGEFSRASPYVLTGMYGAITREEQRLNQEEADSEARVAFVNLPRPILGALAQCMKHSLLAGLCTAWARHHLGNDRKVQARIAAIKLKNAKIGDEQVYLVLESAVSVVSNKTQK